MIFRIVYLLVMYGGLVFVGNVICGFIGVDFWGGFDIFL